MHCQIYYSHSAFATISKLNTRAKLNTKWLVVPRNQLQNQAGEKKHQLQGVVFGKLSLTCELSEAQSAVKW